MSADRLAATLDDAEYAAIEAALSGSERGRLFLIEYRQRARSGELAALIAMVEGMRDRQNGAEVAAHAAGAKLSAALRILDNADEEIADHEGTPADETISLADLTEAAERLQDLTWALREQGTDVATCDLIEAQSREIMTACTRCEAAASRAGARLSAFRALATVLRDVDDDGPQGVAPPIDHRSSGDGGPEAKPLPPGKVSIAEAFADIDALSTREKLALIS